jgi:hypothetical protein
MSARRRTVVTSRRATAEYTAVILAFARAGFAHLLTGGRFPEREIGDALTQLAWDADPNTVEGRAILNAAARVSWHKWAKKRKPQAFTQFLRRHPLLPGAVISAARAIPARAGSLNEVGHGA